MRILVVHNFYQQQGGEDEVVRTEIALLTAAGHQVFTYFRHNDEIRQRKRKLALLPIETVWSRVTYRELEEVIAENRPEVAHFHNTLPLVSPSAYYACQQRNVAVVQTLHNYRFVCPGANLSRGERTCEDCLGASLMAPAMLHGCYRDSVAATATVAAMLAIHRTVGTYANTVQRYIALSEFSRRKFIAGGLPETRIVVKSNSPYPTPEFSTVPLEERNYALFLGRFSGEKGIRTLVKAAKQLPDIVQLRIVGDGPLREEIAKQLNGVRNVSVEAWAAKSEVQTLLRNARLLICPSECYENFPMVVAEAFACGTPVLCSRMGVHQEIVEDHTTGLHFTPGDASDLVDKLLKAWNEPAVLSSISLNAKRKSELEFSPERNRESLVGIYQAAIDERAWESRMPVREALV